jgi:CubicO group peptidase (beta-lactamase class C family)
MKLTIPLLVGASFCALAATYSGAAQIHGSDGLAAATANKDTNRLQTEFAAQVGEHLKELCTAGTFSGTVLVAHRGKQIFASACGLADRARGTSNSLATQYRLASVNKMFTAVALLQLAERGKIRLDDTVGDYLRDYPNKQVATEVTVRQLLNHTGGAGGIWGPEYEAHRLELRTLEDYERLNGSRDPDFPPGSKFAYSNYGYILLGLIVEAVSGQSYYDYVQQRIFRVAGMNATGSEPEDVVVPGRATGYSKRLGNSGDWQSTSGTLPYRGTSAGGGYSTASDLLRFAVALSGHKLLSKRWTEILTTATVDMEWPGFRYACGFMETSLDGVRWIGHDGGSEGEKAEFWLAPKTDDVIIVLSNIDPPSAGTVAQWIAPRIPK